MDKFFVISSSAKYDDTFTNEDINLLVLIISGSTIKGDQRVGIRNYFLERAKLANDVHSLLQSLKALNLLIDVPILNI